MSEPSSATSAHSGRNADAPPSPVVPASPWARIKEHKVLQWSVAYLGAALALAHGQDLLAHAFHWPEAVGRVLIGTLIVGFPVAVALAWYHGHRGMTRFSPAEATIVSLLVVLGAGMLVVFVRTPAEPPGQQRARAALSTSIVPAKSSAQVRQSASDAGPSIAVLPFVNMSNDRDQEYFSDGLSEELLNQLAQLPNLRVIGRTSSFAFKGQNEDLRTIGQALGVDHILEGSVRKSGDQLRITAQLINPANGSHLWSATYDRGLGDIFMVQEDIARTVASALRISIGALDLRQGGTANLEAYDIFLRSRTEPPVASAENLERAVKIDPKFTTAWVQLAQWYRVLQFAAPDRRAEWRQKQIQAVDRVLALAPDSPAAKLLMSGREFADGHLAQADRLLASIQNIPSSASSDAFSEYGAFLIGVGRPRDAEETLAAAREADPLGIGPSILIQINFEILGDYARADAEGRRSQNFLGSSSLNPGGAVLRAMGRRDEVALRKAVSGALTDDGPGHFNAAMLPLLNQPSAALALLKRLCDDPGLDPVSVIVIADWAAYFGDPQLSLQLLRRASSMGVPPDRWWFSIWRPVQKDTRRLPAFKDFVRELGLVDYWRASGKWGEFCRPTGNTDFSCT
jgi:TolB-like protein